jgi:hypothetical protein
MPVVEFGALADGLVYLENDRASRTGGSDSEGRGTYLHHVSRLQACSSLATSVDAHSPSAYRRNPQPTNGTCCQYGVPVVDSRRRKLQVLTGPTADCQPACVKKKTSSRRGGPGRASDGSLA